MSQISREWLRRIPQFVYIDRRKPAWRRARPEEEGDPASLRPGEGDEVPGEALADEDGEDARTNAGAGTTGEDAPHDESPGPQTAANPDGTPTDEPSQPEPLDTVLHIPEEVEAQRREAQEKQQRSNLNRGLAPKAFGLHGHYLRALATRFARMISKVAEDSADLPSPGDEEWDMVELSQRHFTGRHVNQCRMTREKRKVAVVLDTSPSCEHQARLFGAIAHIAETLGDCELYDAPNFGIISRKIGETWETLDEVEREWQFRRRVVLAFGDFDGIERISRASALRGNKIYWFCCEERPSVLQVNRDYFVKHYKGHYFPANDLVQLMRALMRVR